LRVGGLRVGGFDRLNADYRADHPTQRRLSWVVPLTPPAWGGSVTFLIYPNPS